MHEPMELGVAPHPAGKARETVVLAPDAAVAHEAVEVGGVGPVGLQRHDPEAVPVDQASGDRRARPIEFRGSMRPFAEQHHPGVGEDIEGRAKGGVVERGKRPGGVPHGLGQAVMGQRFGDRHGVVLSEPARESSCEKNALRPRIP